MSGYFNYGGVSTADFGIYTTGDATYNIVNRNFDKQSVVGRSGDILIDGGNYPNVEVTYHCGMEAEEGINEKLEAFAAALMTAKGYQRLQDSYHPDIFRMGVVLNPMMITPYRPNNGLAHRAASFDVVFNCKPQKFLESGYTELTLQNGGTVTNPTAYPSKPILIVSGSGTLTISSQTITIDSSCPSSDVTIDCELMDAYSGQTNLNKYVTLPIDDIVLGGGDNTIQMNGVTAKMIPRWWKL